MEIVTGNKTSFGLSVFGNCKPWGMDMKMVGAIPEFRYWFGGRPMMREFIGVAALGTSYDITWGSETYKGDAWGGGLTFGYAFLLTPLEHRMLREWVPSTTTTSITTATTIIPKTAAQRNGYAFIPFKLGVSFAYIIK